jgi:hypothetical protein
MFCFSMVCACVYVCLCVYVCVCVYACVCVCVHAVCPHFMRSPSVIPQALQDKKINRPTSAAAGTRPINN